MIDKDNATGEITLQPDITGDAGIRSLSRRSFLWAGAAVIFTATSLRWLGTRELNNGIPWPLRRMLGVNEKLSRAYFRGYRLSPEFPESLIGDRVNGTEGLDSDVDVQNYRIRLQGLHDMSGATSGEDGKDMAVEIGLDVIRRLPVHTMVTELKCIEGWSVVVKWKGARLCDLIAQYPPATNSGKAPDISNSPEDLPEYVAMQTPDNVYYVGLDMAAALHPQTLLCYEMNGAPLTPEHGAPLRLAIPVKYGVKNLKRIGSIQYTRLRPADYWAERGYDWYAGH